MTKSIASPTFGQSVRELHAASVVESSGHIRILHCTTPTRTAFITVVVIIYSFSKPIKVLKSKAIGPARSWSPFRAGGGLTHMGGNSHTIPLPQQNIQASTILLSDAFPLATSYKLGNDKKEIQKDNRKGKLKKLDPKNKQHASPSGIVQAWIAQSRLFGT